MDKVKLDESLNVVNEASKRALEAETPLLVNFSGGKDSSCVLLLAKEVTDNVELIYMASGLELPGTIEFVQKEADKLKLKLHLTDPVKDYMGDIAFWVKHYGYFPYFGAAFCSSRLKLRASRAYLRKIFGYKHMYRLNGVRKSESTRRAHMYKNIQPIRPDRDLSGSFIVQPIQEWNKQDVLDYLAEKNFVVQKQYSSFGISGCGYCPFYEVEIYYRILAVYPNFYDELILLEDEVKKPACRGNIYLRDIRKNFFENREEIIANLSEPKGRKS